MFTNLAISPASELWDVLVGFGVQLRGKDLQLELHFHMDMGLEST